MWPFKKKKVITYEELVKTYAPAPCGQQYEHYYWTEIEGWNCPHCDKIAKVVEELAKEERIARLTAKHVVFLLNANKGLEKD